MKITKKSGLIWVLGIIAVAAVVYFVSAGSFLNTPKNTENQTATESPSATTTSPSPATKNEDLSSKYNKLLIWREISSNQSPHPGNKITQLVLVDLKNNSEKLVFTDVDEGFQLRLIGGIVNGEAIIFGTQLNELNGALYKVKLDGSGTKQTLFSDFTPASFAAGTQKVIYTSYDNAAGNYSLWTVNYDGRFKTKIFESESLITDPIFIDDGTIAFVRINQKGEGVINTISIDGKNQKEIFQSSGQSIYGLNYGDSKFTYIKSPVGTSSKAQAEVYTLNRDGSGEKKITADTQPDNYPVISPDGLLIAFYKNSKIWTGKSDSQNLKALAAGVRPIAFLK